MSFLKRNLFNESNNTEKNPPRGEEENQKKRQRLTIADCAVVVLKRSLEIQLSLDG